jgi:DNA polymerase-3 subunit delta'
MGISDFSKYGNSISRLKSAILNSMVSHAYLIEGDYNTDKKGVALAFAAAVLCRENPGEGCGSCRSCRNIKNGCYEDLYLTEPESKSKGIGQALSIKDAQIENLQVRLKSVPTGGGRNIAVISDADSMTMRAQTRLLKTLEEPTPGTVIILLSENSELLLQTIRSRCVKVRLNSFAGGDAAGPTRDDAGAADGCEAGSGTDMRAYADEVLKMIINKDFFFDIKEKLDAAVKSRKDAYAFLDGMEFVLERYLRSGNDLITSGALTEDIGYVEKARRDIQRSASFRYCVRNLVLKMRGI